jgi:hypothetical protein
MWPPTTRSWIGCGTLWRGNLLCGVMGDELLIRVDAR